MLIIGDLRFFLLLVTLSLMFQKAEAPKRGKKKKRNPQLVSIKNGGIKLYSGISYCLILNLMKII